MSKKMLKAIMAVLTVFAISTPAVQASATETNALAPLRTPVLAESTIVVDGEPLAIYPVPYVLAGADGNIHYVFDDDKNAEIRIVVLDRDLQLVRTFAVDREMPLFGCATMDSDGNYYLSFGRLIESLTAVTEDNLMVVKYSSDGTKLGSLVVPSTSTVLTGTRAPFCVDYPGPYSEEMVISGSILTMYYGHQLFMMPDGLNHQTSAVLYVNTDTMERVFLPEPYSSHSSAQRVIATSDGGFLFADDADANPRGFAINKLLNGELSSFTSFRFRQFDPYQTTNSALGGLAEIAPGYLLVGASERTLSSATVRPSQKASRDLFIQIIDKDFGSKALDSEKTVPVGENRPSKEGDTVDYNVLWLTEYPEYEQANNISVAEGDDHVIIMWDRIGPWQFVIEGRTYQTNTYLDSWYMILSKSGAIVRWPAKIDGDPRPLAPAYVDYFDGRLYWAEERDGITIARSLAVLGPAE